MTKVQHPLLQRLPGRPAKVLRWASTSGGAGVAEAVDAGAKVRRRVRGLPSQAFAQSAAEPQPARPTPPPPPAYERPAPEPVSVSEPAAAAYERPARAEAPTPQLPSERAAHGRGDPALASRMAHLESLLRRLVQSPLHRLEECEDAPAGPGVLLLSDSDQITSYYVEACQTLRIGAGNLVRGGRSARTSRGGRRIFRPMLGMKGRLAEYLGINEAKVSQYMKDHCVLRWIQLDDEAPLAGAFRDRRSADPVEPRIAWRCPGTPPGGPQLAVACRNPPQLVL